jgi:hypothetical protein
VKEVSLVQEFLVMNDLEVFKMYLVQGKIALLVHVSKLPSAALSSRLDSSK